MTVRVWVASHVVAEATVGWLPLLLNATTLLTIEISEPATGVEVVSTALPPKNMLVEETVIAEIKAEPKEEVADVPVAFVNVSEEPVALVNVSAGMVELPAKSWEVEAYVVMLRKEPVAFVKKRFVEVTLLAMRPVDETTPAPVMRNWVVEPT